MARRMAQNGTPTHDIKRQGPWEYGDSIIGRPHPRRVHIILSVGCTNIQFNVARNRRGTRAGESAVKSGGKGFLKKPESPDPICRSCLFEACVSVRDG